MDTKIQQIREKTHKQLELLDELERNTRLLSKDYYVEQVDTINYVLVRSVDLKVVKMDKLERIKSYINLRGLSNKTIID